jgi:hypothetical protein
VEAAENARGGDRSKARHVEVKARRNRPVEQVIEETGQQEQDHEGNESPDQEPHQETEIQLVFRCSVNNGTQTALANMNALLELVTARTASDPDRHG